MHTARPVDTPVPAVNFHLTYRNHTVVIVWTRSRVRKEEMPVWNIFGDGDLQWSQAPDHELFSDGPLAWQQFALCAQTDPEAFFPEKGGSTREAKSVCASCEVRSYCLEYALMNDERFGIWGGLSERERRKMRRAAS